MLMNRVETALMNNPARRSIQRRIEVPLLRRLGGVMAGGTAVEIGCGQGYGSQLIVECFGAASVVAVEPDPRMIRLATHRLRSHGLPVTVVAGVATALPVGDETQDAVFDFGVLHHVEDWRKALDEVRRVLRLGGRFYFEEVTARALARPSYRRFLRHPEQDRFTGHALIEALAARGIVVGLRYRELVRGDFVIGVGERMS